MRTIDAFIIGAQKAGTTSLQNYLALHPAICTHWQSEAPFFGLDELYQQGYAQAFKRYFSACQDPDSLLLAKSVDVMYSAVALARLRDHNPHCKLLLILRNPVDRAHSAFWYAIQIGREIIPEFDEAVWVPPEQRNDALTRAACAYLQRGLYAQSLEQIYQRFPPENVRVYRFEDFQSSPATICQDAFAFLGVAPFPLEIAKRHNVASIPKSMLLAKGLGQHESHRWLRRAIRQALPAQLRDQLRAWLRKKNRRPFGYPPMNPETRQKLVAYFEPHNRRLTQIWGVDLASWNQ